MDDVAKMTVRKRRFKSSSTSRIVTRHRSALTAPADGSQAQDAAQAADALRQADDARRGLVDWHGSGQRGAANKAGGVAGGRRRIDELVGWVDRAR